MISGLRGLFAPRPTGAELNLRRLKAAFKHLPVLEGERLRLRAPRLEDAADLYCYARDEENCRYVLWDKHRSLSHSREVLRTIIWQNRRGLPGTFAIELKAEGRLIGTIGFQSIDAEALCAEVGYTIARRLWGRGLATEALGLLLAYAFDTLLLGRVEASHDVLNPASGAVMRKAGMKETGLEAGSLIIKGRRADMMRYAIDRADWEAGR